MDMGLHCPTKELWNIALLKHTLSHGYRQYALLENHSDLCVVLGLFLRRLGHVLGICLLKATTLGVSEKTYMIDIWSKSSIRRKSLSLKMSSTILVANISWVMFGTRMTLIMRMIMNWKYVIYQVTINSHNLVTHYQMIHSQVQ